MTKTITPEIILIKIQELQKNKEEEEMQNVVLDFFNNNKKRIYSKIQETIIELFLKSSIKSRKLRNIKDALIYFKSITQGKLDNYVNMLTFIKDLVEKELQANSKLLNFVSKKDLDEEDSSDHFLKLALDNSLKESNLDKNNNSRELTQNNKESRDQGVSLVRFVSDVYRVLLDFTKVNNKLLEHSYKILKSTFAFYKQFSLKNEFKRICDSMRGYLLTLIKSNNKTASSVSTQKRVDLNNLDVIRILIQIRTSLLETAVQLSQWQEAFKTSEDIVFLINKFSYEVKLREKNIQQQLGATNTTGVNNINSMQQNVQPDRVTYTIPDKQMFEYFLSLSKLFDKTNYYLLNSFALIMTATSISLSNVKRLKY